MPSPSLILQTAAFTLQESFKRLPLVSTALALPEGWLAASTRLQAELRDRIGQDNTPPLDSLNTAIEAIIPHLWTGPLHSQALERADASRAWLIAEKEIDPVKISLIAQAWLAENFQNCASYDEERKWFVADALTWQQHSSPFSTAPCENGTARPSGDMYTALPALLATRLVQNGLMVRVRGVPTPTVRVPIDKGAELMTWPPAVYTKGDRRWPFSYTIKITLQTMPGDPQPRVHFHYGLRRWMSSPVGYIEGKKSVYLQSIEPWLGLDNAGAMTRAYLKRRYDSGPEGTGWGTVWHGLGPAIARRLQVGLPSAQAVADDPLLWIDGVEGVYAAIVEHTPKSPLNPGVDLQDHEDITNNIADALKAELSLCPPHQRAHTPRQRRSNPLTKNLREMSEADRLTAFAESVGSCATVEVWWETECVRDMLIDRLKALLCWSRPEMVKPEPGEKKRSPGRPEEAPSPATDPQDIALPDGGRLRIVPRRLGHIGALFPAPLTPLRKHEKGKYRKTETLERLRQINIFLPDPVEEPTLALMQLPNHQEKAVRKDAGYRDPKDALRLGLGRTGRVTKFTTGEDQALKERCESTVGDGLRQMGYLPAPIGMQFTGSQQLPDDLVVVGVWLLNLNKKEHRQAIKLPVAVIMHTGRREVWAWLPDGKGMRSYYQAQVDITRMSPEQARRGNLQNSLGWLQQFLTNDLRAQGFKNTLIIALSQNIRSVWPGLNNNAVVEDALCTSPDAPKRAVRDIEGRIRLIRLRSSRSNETPEWYVPGAPSGGGFTQGVWENNAAPRIFYNNAGKPKMMSAGRKGKQVDPREHYAIPSLLEVYMQALQEDDIPNLWASAVNQWRQMGNLLTDETLLLPIPLAWAAKMGAYADVISPFVDGELWANDEDEGG